VIQSGTGLSTGGFLSVDGTADLHDTSVTGNLSVSVIRNNDSTIVKIEDGVDVDGNVTADYFIGDGSQLTNLPGSTGNVTFNDQVVVGTGDQVGSGGLYLAPGNTSVGNLQYWRVRGGDVATHMHLDTGNNAYFDQYFGDDGKYVKLESGGNVQIGSNDAVGNAAQWTFDTTGNLTVPGGGAVFSIGTGTMGVTANATSGNAYLGLDDTSSAATLYGNAGVQIGTNGNVSWNFQPSGNLSAPGNIIAVGNVTGGNIVTAGSGGDIALTGGNITGALRVTTTPTALANLSAIAGGRAFVNNANLVAVGNFGNQVGSGGSNTVPVWSDGSNWYIG
jgi:hypothetical protein